MKMSITEYDQGISHETGDADEREENENSPRDGALEFMVKQNCFVAPQEGMRVVAAHLAEHRCSSRQLPFLCLTLRCFFIVR